MTDLELLNRILVQFKIRAGSPRDARGRVVSIGGGALGGAKPTATAAVARPEPVKPATTAGPATATKKVAAGQPVLPGRPIGERIKADAASHEKVAAVARIDDKHGATIAKLDAESRKLSGEGSTLFDRHGYDLARWPPAARSRLAELGQKMEAAGTKAAALREQARQEAHAILKAKDPLPVVLKHGPTHDRNGPLAEVKGEQRTAADDGAKWLSSVTERAGIKGGHEMAVGSIPDHLEQRSYAGAAIALDKVSRQDVVIHELGHTFEDRLMSAGGKAALPESVGVRAREFLAHRVGNEPAARLSDVAPGHGYAASEVGRKDRFEEAFGPQSAYYVGKHYADGSTEILSMGVQKLYNDPVGFARKDPEYMGFVVGLLHGTLR